MRKLQCTNKLKKNTKGGGGREEKKKNKSYTRRNGEGEGGREGGGEGGIKMRTISKKEMKGFLLVANQTVSPSQITHK